MRAKKPKILYIITQSELGGAQKNVLDLARGLKNSYEILVAAGPDGGGVFFKQLADNKIKFKELRWLRRSAKNPVLDLLGLIEITALIKKELPKIIHLHSSKAGFLGALAGKFFGVKIIYTVHGAVFEAPFSNMARALFLYLEKFGAFLKNKIICVSNNYKKLWLKYKVAPEEKLTVIHNGIDLNADFMPKEEAREYLFSQSARLFEAARGFGPDLKIIGTIANFYPEKGLTFLIEAAAKVLKKEQFNKNLIFVVIGEGIEKELLEEMIESHNLENKFILTGALTNPSRYLKAFDIFVLPSIKEGLPYTILEAMAAGLPIIASYIGGIPEMIDTGKNGFLVLPRNSEMLADRIETLLKDPTLAQQFSQTSQEKIQEFSLEKMVEETDKVYQLLQ